MLTIDFEEWRSIELEGIETKYEISSYGRVRNGETGKILKTSVDKCGYERVRLSFGRKHKVSKSVHRLVAEAFIYNPQPDVFNEVNHKNGDKLDNRVENLEWSSRQSNMLHAFRTGLCKAIKGEKHKKSKYKEKQIREICELMQAGLSNKVIAKIVGIDRHYISQIRRKRVWTEISDDYKINPERVQMDYSKYWEIVDNLLLQGYSKKQIKEINVLSELTKQQRKSLVNLRIKHLQKEGKL